MLKSLIALGPDVARPAARFRAAFIAVAILSLVLNVLVISGSIYLMLVYDSVLPSRSIPSLFGLFALLIVAYIFVGLFETMRSQILRDVGSSLERALAPRVQHAISEMFLRGARGAGDGLIPMRDLDSVRSFLSGSGPGTLIDFPFSILLLALLALLHPWLAVATFAGMCVLLSIALLTERGTRDPVQQLSLITANRSSIAENNARHVEVLTGLGMKRRMRTRWESLNQVYLAASDAVSKEISWYGGLSRTFRMFLQSFVVTVGALLVIYGHASGGVIFASSIIAGRALAPVDQAIGNWRSFSAARGGWARLKELLHRFPEEAPTGIALPVPSKTLEVTGVYVAAPGTQRMIVNGVSLKLAAGDALGIIGPSAAGKSSLGRTLIGVWQPVRGDVRLDGATLDQWSSDRLGAALGYLPQTVELIQGTVGENIARFDPEGTSDAIISAAREAGVHEMIVQLPDGYDTTVGIEGQELSAGQRQRIGLARALYGEPFLVLLDEPNSNLDQDGETALERAVAQVRARGGIVVVIAHRATVLSQVSHILVMREGRAEAFGPRDDILNRMRKPGARPAPGRTIAAASAANT